MARTLSLRLETVSGTIERFYAFVDGQKRIVADALAPALWTGEVADAGVSVKVRVFGIGHAKFRLNIDLPGTIDDQSLELWLDQGYGEMELML